MKKTIISSALRFIPKKLQNNALCKALNYLLQGQSLHLLEGKVLKLNVTDLKKSWAVTCIHNKFEPIKSKVSDIEVKTHFNTALQLQDKPFLLDVLNKGDVELSGEKKLIEEVKELVSAIDEQRLFNLSNHFFKFLKIKSPHAPRLDINTVTLSDLKTPQDVDFIIGEAIKLETRDLNKALSLMLLAKAVRPNGQLVVKKVAEYQEKLDVQISAN